MRKRYLSMCCCTILPVLLSLPLNVQAKTGLSERLLLPGEEPVRVKFPGVERYVEIRSIRQLPDGAEIDPANAASFRILCQDLTTIDVAPGESFTCPEAPEFRLVAEVDPPPPPPPLLDFQRGKELSSLTSAEKEALKEAESAIESLDLGTEQKIFLRAHAYESLKLYKLAIEVLEESRETFRDPVMLRLLGNLYLKNERAREAYHNFAASAELAKESGNLEEQAASLQYMAVLLKNDGFPEESRKQAQEALELYQTLGNTEQIEVLQNLLEEE